jgi:digeranylgeranylglycerophospholipid reductase
MSKKVAIIGAGPGGLFAAKEAAALGLTVTVFEKAKIGERIFCAEGFVDVLKLLPPPAAGMLFPVNQLLITVKDQFTIDCSRLNLWMIDRQTWQKALAREAVASGCEIIEQHPITPNCLQEMLKEYDWVIDGSGVRSVAAEAFQLPNVPKAVTAQYTLEGDFSSLVGKLKVVLNSRCCGYGWVFPKSSTIANVGLGWFGKRKKGLRLKTELDSFLQKEGFSHYKIVKRAGGPIPTAPRGKIAVGNTLLIGDAAGLGSPLHGGGVDTACISGILAARAAAKNIPSWYEQAVHKLIGVRLSLEQKILDLWEATDFETLNRYASLAFAKKSGLGFWKKLLIPEATALTTILSGKIRGDWEKGIILDDLPLLPKMILARVMRKLPGTQSIAYKNTDTSCYV